MQEIDPSSIYVIREIYESESSTDTFACELEGALSSQYKFIIIEPKRLAEETSRWIQFGNLIHRASVLASTSSICASLLLVPQRQYISYTLCGISVVCTTVYMISWNWDHCCKYQVDTDLSKFNERDTKTATKVLVYKDNRRLNYVQRAMTASAVLICGYQLYRALK